jgi:hypothetical protein
MRGSDERTGSLFSYVNLEARVRGDHPLRVIREIANAAPRRQVSFRGCADCGRLLADVAAHGKVVTAEIAARVQRPRLWLGCRRRCRVWGLASLVLHDNQGTVTVADHDVSEPLPARLRAFAGRDGFEDDENLSLSVPL